MIRKLLCFIGIHRVVMNWDRASGPRRCVVYVQCKYCDKIKEVIIL